MTLDVHRVKTGRPASAPIRNACASSATQCRTESSSAAIGVAPQLEKRKAPQLLEEHRVGPRAGDAKWKAALVVEIEHERVGQHAANRAGIDIVAFRRAARAPQLVPVRIEFHRGSELHP